MGEGDHLLEAPNGIVSQSTQADATTLDAVRHAWVMPAVRARIVSPGPERERLPHAAVVVGVLTQHVLNVATPVLVPERERLGCESGASVDGHHLRVVRIRRRHPLDERLPDLAHEIEAAPGRGHLGDHAGLVIDRDSEVAAFERTHPQLAGAHQVIRERAAHLQSRRRGTELPAGTELLLVTHRPVQRDRLAIVLYVLLDDPLGGGTVGEIGAGSFGIECGKRLQELGTDPLGGQAQLHVLTQALFVQPVRFLDLAAR